MYEATSTTLKIAVPPLLNPANGKLAAAAVKVQVVQASKTFLSTSSRVTGLCISQISLVPRQVPAGAVTRAYLNFGLDALSDTLTANALPSSLKPALRALKTQ